MEKGYELKGGVLEINRDLTELDEFVKDFLDILKKHSDYLIVSGFVSISTGRTRATEDVDVLIPVPKEETFEKVLNELDEKGFWCFQGDLIGEVWPYIQEKKSIRFAKKEQMFPNMEVIFIDESNKTKYYEFTNPQKIRIKDFEFKIPPLEFEILYKEIILAGKKDLEDAMHLRTLFKNILSEDKFKECKEVIISDKEKWNKN